MSDPKQHHDESDDLDLDAETVADLDPDDAAAVQGGMLVKPTAVYTDAPMCTFTCLACTFAG
jgi:hypothetical protein